MIFARKEEGSFLRVLWQKESKLCPFKDQLEGQSDRNMMSDGTRAAELQLCAQAR